jgi:hypothetical protein
VPGSTGAVLPPPARVSAPPSLPPLTPSRAKLLIGVGLVGLVMSAILSADTPGIAARLVPGQEEPAHRGDGSCRWPAQPSSSVGREQALWMRVAAIAACPMPTTIWSSPGHDVAGRPEAPSRWSPSRHPPPAPPSCHAPPPVRGRAPSGRSAPARNRGCRSASPPRPPARPRSGPLHPEPGHRLLHDPHPRPFELRPRRVVHLQSLGPSVSRGDVVRIGARNEPGLPRAPRAMADHGDPVLRLS